MADPNHHLRSDGFLVLLYVDDITILYPDDTTKAAVEVNARLSEMYEIINPNHPHEFLTIEIHSGQNGTNTGIGLGLKACIATMFKWFNIQNAHHVSTPGERNVKLDLAEDQRRKN